MRLRIAQLKRDPTLQICAQMNPDVIEAYAESMRAGDAVPLPVVFYDGSNHWLADGYCRVAAAVRVGIKELDVEVKMGDKRDAIEWAFKTKASQAARPTNADKRRAAEMAPRAQPKLSDRVIARQVRVGAPLAGHVRKSIC